MGLIKFTILIWVIYYVYLYFVKSYLNSHPLEALKFFSKNYIPAYKILLALLNLIRLVLFIFSTAWFLFFR